MPLDKRFAAYQLLRELDAITSSIMNQVAYGRIGDPSWKEAQAHHREVFEKWMSFAATLNPPELCGLGNEDDNDSAELRSG
ncbi:MULTISPECIES: hypothetical protein [Pseudomonas]|uniref:hypothetical protein n=1 Tax=Pseudomonas TaxID=286 RepID=UPI001644B1A8|nr:MULTISPECIES: hypothetical protein [Pseudomonas]QXI46119.1 hypothetical protein HU763_015195 [Pseudomonas anuradhapurensis]